MSALGELFVSEELTEMSSNVELLNLSKERFLIPNNFYEIWREEDLPTEGKIEIVAFYDDLPDNYETELSEDEYEEGTKVGVINYELKHFVDDWGYGKFINHYIKKIERNGIVKKFKKDNFIK